MNPGTRPDSILPPYYLSIKAIFQERLSSSETSRKDTGIESSHIRANPDPVMLSGIDLIALSPDGNPNRGGIRQNQRQPSQNRIIDAVISGRD